MGISLNTDWREPLDELNPSDWAAAERALQWNMGWFANPIFGDGDYPQVMKDKIQDKSSAAGLAKSRLPEFTEDEKNMIRGMVCRSE